MKCNQCESKISLNANYCESCGAKTPPFQERLKTKIEETGIFIKKRKVPILIIATIVILCVATTIVLNASTRFDPTKYIEINISGNDGYGVASAYVNVNSLYERLIGEIPDLGDEELLNYRKITSKWRDAIRVSFNKTSQIKNGDKLIVTVEIVNPKLFKDYGANITKTQFELKYTVGEDGKPLSEALHLDIFEYINIEFSGDNGGGSAKLFASEEEIDTPFGEKIKISLTPYGPNLFGLKISSASKQYALISLRVNNRTLLNNGDKVTLTISETDEYKLRDNGIYITKNTKSYEVSGLT